MRFKFAAISVCLLLLLFACPMFAQTTTPAPAPAPGSEVTDIFAAGGSFNQTSIPQFAGTVFYAHNISAGLYSFTVVDIFAQSVTPDPAVPHSPTFSITTSPTTGVAQKLRDVGKVKIYVIATVGGAAGGTRVGWSFTTGGCAYIPIGKSFSVIPNFRALKSSLGDVQGIYGIAFGWGK